IVPIMSRAPRPAPPEPTAAKPPVIAVQTTPTPPAVAAAPTRSSMSSDGSIDRSLLLQHRVAAGENLKRIAAHYHVTAEFLSSLNKLKNPDRIPSGTALKVVDGPFNAVIDKGAFRMDVTLGETLYRSFPVGLGANGSTPT